MTPDIINYQSCNYMQQPQTPSWVYCTNLVRLRHGSIPGIGVFARPFPAAFCKGCGVKCSSV